MSTSACLGDIGRKPNWANQGTIGCSPNTFARVGVFRWAWRGSEDANAMGDPLAQWVDLSLIEELVYMSKSADTNNEKKELP